MTNFPRIAAVDFDGTLCVQEWPNIGAPKLKVINYIKYLQAHGTKLILWTNRSGGKLQEAIDWCAKNHDLHFDAVNENLMSSVEFLGGEDPRKILADVFIDDRAVTPEYIESLERY